ncbi:MAG: FG-GAP repeat protein [Ignavibacteria bacterium]|nr:FG-GAP repeat protein [Ignavibacteria bacterium]
MLLGLSVSTAGDMNGDGISADLIIGADQNDGEDQAQEECICMIIS